MPGDGSFSKRLLYVAAPPEQTAMFEKKAAGEFNRSLLLGEPKAIRHKADLCGINEIWYQSRTMRRSARDGRAELESHCASEFRAAHDRF
jgi:hypothetical protein